MTREDLRYALRSCGCMYHNGQTYYEENELMQTFEDLGMIKEDKSIMNDTELDKAIRHIKTRADAWAVKEVTDALRDISERLEPCTDAVSREDAINALANVPCYSGSIKSRMVGAIEGLPSVTQTSGKWISVSERSAKAPCLASDNYKNQPFVVTEVITEKYEDGSIRCFDARGFSFSEKSAEWPKREIIAWMPLPKPYEPKESEDKE